ncbi:hypothetical protein DXG03_001695 [Asterophora parasitica]|uniref:Uncharacterized protein n=1 Tax=Asterophora parasitica TaxID=117018 RepID=A0A9P7GH24_9AGAR|nr:hypothetical protein DXG03_001695 [Asterophora parasitica]
MQHDVSKSERVLQRTLPEGAWNRLLGAIQNSNKRNQIATYTPDFCSLLIHWNQDSDEVFYNHKLSYIVVGIVRELTIPQVRCSADKSVVIFVPKELGLTHGSISNSSTSTNEPQTELIAKWRAGLSRACASLLSANESCSSFLGYAMVGARLTRLLAVENMIIVECSTTFLNRLGNNRHVMKLNELLDDDAHVDHLPLNVFQSESRPAIWDFDVVEKLSKLTYRLTPPDSATLSAIMDDLAAYCHDLSPPKKEDTDVALVCIGDDGKPGGNRKRGAGDDDSYRGGNKTECSLRGGPLLMALAGRCRSRCG